MLAIVRSVFRESAAALSEFLIVRLTVNLNSIGVDNLKASHEVGLTAEGFEPSAVKLVLSRSQER
jgi:hypothetical protein